METIRLPVARTVRLALRDTADIFVRMPVLCGLSLLVAILLRWIEEVVVGPVSLEAINPEFRPEIYVIGFAKYIYFVPLAVLSCRFLIIGRSPSWLEVRTTKNIMIVYSVVSIAIYILIAAPIIAIEYLINMMESYAVIVSLSAGVIFSIFIMHWIMRWSLIYPAIAVDQRDASLRWSARKTKGMVWRIFLVQLVVPMIAVLATFPFLIGKYSIKFEAWAIVPLAFIEVFLGIFLSAAESEIYVWCCANRKSYDVAAPRTVSERA